MKMLCFSDFIADFTMGTPLRKSYKSILKFHNSHHDYNAQFCSVK